MQNTKPDVTWCSVSVLLKVNQSGSGAQGSSTLNNNQREIHPKQLVSYQGMAKV